MLFRSLPVPIPTLDEQQSLLKTKSRLDELLEVLLRIEQELAANPGSVAEVNDQVVPMLQVLGRLSAADEVRERIRAGESKRVEFKQTFSLNSHTGKKDARLEDSALKTIVAFLNSDGGDLLVGVTDDGLIPNAANDDSRPALTAEIDSFYKKKGVDGFLLHIRTRLKERVGAQFYPYIEQHVVSLDGGLVLWFTCKAADSPAFLDDDNFYVRTNPATDELRGPKMQEYIKARF